MKFWILVFISIVAAALIVILFTKSSNIEKAQKDKPSLGAHISMNIILAPNNTYGYNILKNGVILIHQQNMPAISGNEGFKTKCDAKVVAEFVIHKIKNHIFPPSISIKELDSLGVIKNNKQSKYTTPLGVE